MTTGYLRDENAGANTGYLRAELPTAAALTSASVSSITATTATGSITTDQALGTLYAVVTNSITQPSADQIRLGLNHLSAAALYAGSLTISTTGAKTFNATALASGATLYFHFAQFIGDVTTVVSSSSFVTTAGSSVTSVNGNVAVNSDATGIIYAGLGFGATQGTGTIQWRKQGTSLVQAQTASAWNNTSITANGVLGQIPYSDINHTIEAVVTPQGGSALTRTFTLLPPVASIAYPVAAASATQVSGSLFNQLPFVPGDGDQVVAPILVGGSALTLQLSGAYATGLIDSSVATGTFSATYWRASNQSWYDISATLGAGSVTAFTFTAQSGVTRGATATSNTVTLAGFTVAQPITIAGGQYKINAGAYTSSAGTVNAGDTLTIQLVASSSFNTLQNATVTVGSYTTSFNVTSELADTTPNTFSFTPITTAPINTVFTSSSITVAGINAAAAISVTGASYSVNGGTPTTSAGSVNVGDVVTLVATSSSSFNTTITPTLTIGGVSASWSISTFTGDTVPDQFTFVDQTGVALSTVITSAPIVVSGINAPSAISITGGTYSINGAAYVSTAGTVNNGDSITVRHTSSGSLATQINTVLTIGGIVDTFSSVTIAVDTTPNPFGFSPLIGMALSTVYTSELQTITGINTAANCTVTNGTVSINGGAYTASPGNINANDTVRLKTTSSSSFNTNIAVTLTIGGVAAVWNVSTLSISLFVVD